MVMRSGALTEETIMECELPRSRGWECQSAVPLPVRAQVERRALGLS
jgi:hypothetical protein